MAQGRQPPFEVFNDVERHLLRATRDETSTPEWAAVAEDVGRLPSELPAALDPDEAPESGAELALLAQILGGQAAPLSSTSAPEGAGRAGYALVGVQHDAARAWAPLTPTQGAPPTTSSRPSGRTSATSGPSTSASGAVSARPPHPSLPWSG